MSPPHSSAQVLRSLASFPPQVLTWFPDQAVALPWEIWFVGSQKQLPTIGGQWRIWQLGRLELQESRGEDEDEVHSIRA